jgi:hypothetical protein
MCRGGYVARRDILDSNLDTVERYIDHPFDAAGRALAVLARSAGQTLLRAVIASHRHAAPRVYARRTLQLCVL